MNRIRAGYCTVPNPYNSKQISQVSLHPEQVDVIVFWTRYPAPLIPYLSELDRRGYKYYFQFTLLKYPRPIEEKTPSPKEALQTFRELADKVGPDRVIWRYDPIVFSNRTDFAFHTETYQELAGQLRGYTKRSVISLVDSYRFAEKRLGVLQDHGIVVTTPPSIENPSLVEMIQRLVQIASASGMEISSCAEVYPLENLGVRAGKCVDDDYIQAVFGISVEHHKDPSQRLPCRCVISKDIGMYDSCLFGCTYCYANTSFGRARINHARHNPNSESML